MSLPGGPPCICPRRGAAWRQGGRWRPSAARATRQPDAFALRRNFRVTAFYGPYAIKQLGWSVEQAEAFRAPIWHGSDHPVWEGFIREMRQRLAAEASQG
jgi:hypothetical protein